MDRNELKIWKENMQMVFGVWEQRYKNNYPILIDKIAFDITKGGKNVALLLKIIADALEEAQKNPTQKNWKRLKKVLLENPPENN